MPTREKIEFDVVIVGAGPAGLSAAIRLKQKNPDIKICILEKGSEVGAHIISGNVFETRALDELIPNWKDKGAPITRKVSEDSFCFLTKKLAFSVPLLPQMKNHNNYIISLANLCRWLANEAIALGVEIYPGFAASEILFDQKGKVIGVATSDMGISKKGKKKDSYQRGIEIRGKYILLGEGCRGSLTEELFKKLNLRKNCSEQTYAIGIKELWEVKSPLYKPGKVMHSIGYPLKNDVYGGSFIYHLDDNKIYVGYVVGLDYENPYLSPYDEFQNFKLHPKIKPLLEGGKRISYGARALNEGGMQAMPQVVFEGGAIIGCSAGFLNVAKIKGTHTAMKSGMLAADAILNAFKKNSDDISSYEKNLKKSWVWDELYRARNIRPSFKNGLLKGMLYSAIDMFLFRGKAPWTFKTEADHSKLKKAADCRKIQYPKYDNKITFDKLTSLTLSGVNHAEDQPCHLHIKDKDVPVNVNLKEYDAPEMRYCPANVYEYVGKGKEKKLQINAQNCIHCKTCDIKDPTQNIKWVTPEGGGGPRYPNM